MGTKCYAHVPEQKRRKMDRKAVIGYLVRYDGNERYRIYVPDQRNVILFRDVFNEKLRGCKERVILPLNEHIEDGKEEDDTQQYEPFSPPVSSKISAPTTSDNAGESESESEITPNAELGKEKRSQRQRKKPKYLNDYVTYFEAEAFVAEFAELPTTYNEAVENSYREQWKMMMDAEIKSMSANNA